MEDRYRALQDLVRLPIGGGEAVVYAPLDRQAIVLSAEELSTLSRCGQFATLHEHAARMAGPMVSATASLADPVAALRALVDKGVLVSEREIAGRIQAASVEEAAPPPIAHVGVPTGGRNELAVGALQSLIDAAPDREVEIVVAHDAKDAAEVSELARALGPAAARARLRYAGPEERAAYAVALADRAGVDRDLCLWALTRTHPRLWATGMCRNALLLDAVGELSMQVDDDVRSEVCDAPDPEESLAFTSHGSVVQIWFPPPGALAEHLARPRATDLAALHEQLLGKRIASCVAAAPALDLADASGAFLRDVMAGRGRIVGTQLGIIGDSATGSLGHYLLLRGSSRERLVVSEAVYDHAFASRQGLRATRSRTISEATFCMSYALGVDHREMLPPFMPVGRNGDGVFGYVLRHCFRDAYFGFLPVAVAHRPPARPYSVEKLIADARQIDSNDLVCRLVAHSGIQARAAEPQGTLAALGMHLERLAGLPLVDLEELVRTTVLRTRSRDMSHLRTTVEAHYRRPAYWVRDVEQLVAAMSEAALRPEHSHPRDLKSALGDEEGRRALAAQIGQFGRLLVAWPDLWRAALALKHDGVRPSRPLL